MNIKKLIDEEACKISTGFSTQQAEKKFKKGSYFGYSLAVIALYNDNKPEAGKRLVEILLESKKPKEKRKCKKT